MRARVTPPASPRAPIAARPPVVRGVVFIKKSQCKGCELCIEFCPNDVLARSTGFNAKGYHYPVVTKNVCVNCRLCVTVCPEYAIFSTPAPARRRAGAAGTPGGQS